MKITQPCYACFVLQLCNTEELQPQDAMAYAFMHHTQASNVNCNATARVLWSRQQLNSELQTLKSLELQHPTPPTCGASWKRGMAAAAARALACLSGLVAASCRAARPSCRGERGGLRDPSGRPGEGVRMRRLLGNNTGDGRRFRLAFCSSHQMCVI